MTTPSPLRLQVHVQPRASKSEIVGAHSDGIKVRVTAPPVEGAANEALVSLLAESLRVPRRAIRILHGSGSRQKVVEIDDVYAATCRGRLEKLLRAVDKAGPRR